MKKWMAVFIAVAIVVLVACSQGLPKPGVDLPVELASFNTAKYDYNPDLGDFKYSTVLSEAQRTEFQKLLQADRWTDPRELPGRGYTSVIDAVNDVGWNLTIGYWDEEHTIIALFNDDQTQKLFYFAPFEVQEKARDFQKKLNP